MYVAGIGIVFCRGRGVSSLETALLTGWEAPRTVELPYECQGRLPFYCVDPETLKDKSVLRKARRADRFSKLALMAAWDAVQDSQLSISGSETGLGVLVSTAFGPHATTFRFLDEIIEFGEAEVSPTLFSHSVHNAAASYVALALNCTGPALTLTNFAFSFHHALLLAQTWLNEGRSQQVLVGSTEECGTVMEYICSQKLRLATDGKIRPFDFSPTPATVPGEGSLFLMLTKEPAPNTYCQITDICISAATSPHGQPGIFLLDSDGILGDETPYRQFLPQTAPVGAYSPIFGSMMTGSSFHCAIAALMLAKQRRYACPVQDNPFHLNVCTTHQQADMRQIDCIRINCDREPATIRLSALHEGP